RELLAWSKAKHRHIHPLLGFRAKPEPQLISPWCSQGNLTNYLANNPELSSFTKLHLILQTGSGLAYLHSLEPPIFHGDIKPENVLINNIGEAAISDFGLSRPDMYTGLTTEARPQGTFNYMAPELFMEDEPSVSCETDIYAFGGLILTVMSGAPPFAGTPPGKIIQFVTTGVRPKSQSHPKLLADNLLWDLMHQCWEMDPKKRPAMSKVVGKVC
ncbi:hypothetical protein M407DRAFT_84128, partial [Tulasnella calospora MUT 4182]